MQEPSLELHPPTLNVHTLATDNSPVPPDRRPTRKVTVSVTDTLSQVRQKLLEAVLPPHQRIDSFRVYQISSTYPIVSIPPREFQRLSPKRLEPSEVSTLEEAMIQNGDSFVLSFYLEGPPSHRRSMPEPLFAQGGDFFSQMEKPSSSRGPTKDPRPAPKASCIPPGTLGLGNM